MGGIYSPLSKEVFTGLGDIPYPIEGLGMAVLWRVKNDVPAGGQSAIMVMRLRLIEKKAVKQDEVWIDWSPFEEENAGFRVDKFRDLTKGASTAAAISGFGPQPVAPQSQSDIFLNLLLPGASLHPRIAQLWKDKVGDSFKVEPELFWLDPLGGNILGGTQPFAGDVSFDPAFRIVDVPVPSNPVVVSPPTLIVTSGQPSPSLMVWSF